MVVKRTGAPDVDSLGISLETLAFIILKARAYDVQSGVSHLEEGSNPADDREVGVLESRRDNPARVELRAAIAALTPEEQASLVALTWTGRGDFAAEEWVESLKQARERHTGSTSRYLMGIPQLGDFLEEGAAALGFSLSEIEGSMLG